MKWESIVITMSINILKLYLLAQLNISKKCYYYYYYNNHHFFLRFVEFDCFVFFFSRRFFIYLFIYVYGFK